MNKNGSTSDSTPTFILIMKYFCTVIKCVASNFHGSKKDSLPQEKNISMRDK